MLEGEQHVLSYDGFVHAMGLVPTHMTMTETQYTADFHYLEAYQAICRPEHHDDEFKDSNTNAVKLRKPWRILHTLLTKSIIPSLMSGHMINTED
ncbi:unnamed protein product [Linum trigynum]|uniref:Uncharacterized protein n=1 Tax=Linum trigynum TaxID=586398 RepID=A0AAV2FVM6_9ROSI